MISSRDLRRGNNFFTYADDSGHFSTGTPGVPTAVLTAEVSSLTGELLALGGTPQGIAKAQRDAFSRVDRFLAAALK